MGDGPALLKRRPAIAPAVSDALRRSCRIFTAVLALTLLFFSPAHSRDSDNAELHSALAGLRYGVSVTDLDGEVLVSHRAGERFMPASNAKLFVTAAALAAEAELEALEPALQVMLEPADSGPPNLVLVGRGDPTIGYGDDCEARCLETLAAAVADAGITEVGDIIGDDQWFADERRPLGWSWDDLKFGHGTAVSAIAINENVVPLRISPSTTPGDRVQAAWVDTGPGYFELQNGAKTADEDAAWALRLERRFGDLTARLYGELPTGSRTVTLDLGVDNPAHLAAWYFRRALEAEGVSVTGDLLTRRRPLQYADEPLPIDPGASESPLQCAASDQAPTREMVIASLPPASVRDVVNTVNRDSQNLYAEVLLRQLGRAAGTGSTFCGLLQIENHLDAIGVPRASFHIADGSGLSNYNRATPEAITALLRHAASAPWGDAFRESLPVGGGSDGTLKFRFRGTPLEGQIFAKTGTLNHVDALSGYMLARSGQTLVFSIIVNDRPLDTPSAMHRIDAALLEIAERY